MSAETLIARARALIGVPFRLHGRSAAEGLDCVGLVALATGCRDGVSADYALRNMLSERWQNELDVHFVRRAGDSPQKGDIILMRSGPAQFHLGIFTGAGLIHADARLRRVAELPGPLAWPIIGIWHAPDQ